MDRIPESSSSTHQGPGRGTILIVEDEQLMLRLLEKVFSRHGYHVFAAADGEQAIEVYRCYKLRIDIVLLDVGLPKMTGWQVLSKMKDENPDVRIVIASGYLKPELKSQMSRAGIQHFIGKPYMLHELVETIQSLIEKQ